MMFDLQIGGRTVRAEIGRSAEDTIVCVLDGTTYELEACLPQPGVLSLLLCGKAYRCILDQSAAGKGDAHERAILVGGRRFSFTIEDPRSLRNRRGRGAQADGPKPVKAPMPGRVVRVLVAAGDEVAAQQGVVVIEAMKMQNELKSPKAGKVVRIAVAVGDTVQSGDVLAVVA